jgi:hypothetical protein
MKNLITPLILAFLFIACEHTEDNSPSLQANIETVFFKAITSDALVTEDGSKEFITITGLAENQEMTLHFRWQGHKTYDFGPESDNYASFITAEGLDYNTNTEGSYGEITITKRNYRTNPPYISGEFNFTSIVPGLDTITIHRGNFYKVPLYNEVLEPEL